MYVIKQNMTDSFLCYMSCVKRYSACTIEMYKSVFRVIGITNAWCYNLNKDSAREMVWKWSEKGLSASTINKYTSLLRTFFNYLVRIEFLKSNPWNNIPKLKENKKLPRFLSISDINKIYEYKWKDSITDREDSLCISLLLNYGLRVSELASLKIKDIDIFKKTIHITKGKGNKERRLPMLLEDEDVFITMAKTMDKEDYVMPVRLHYHYQIRYVIHKRIEQICNRQNISPHSLRHTFATMLINNGMSIQVVKELLGHSSVATTQLYTHISISSLKESYNKAFMRSNAHARPSIENKPLP